MIGGIGGYGEIGTEGVDSRQHGYSVPGMKQSVETR